MAQYFGNVGQHNDSPRNNQETVGVSYKPPEIIKTRPPQSVQSTRFSCRHISSLPGTEAKNTICIVFEVLNDTLDGSKVKSEWIR